MNKYLKILLISIAIQIGGLIIAFIIDKVTSSEKSTLLPFYIIAFAVILSMIINIILALKWGRSWFYKLVYILLMPTNYSWLLAIVILVRFIDILIKIFKNLPPNFG